MKRILVDIEGRWVDVMVDPPESDDQILVLDWDGMESIPKLALPTTKDVVAWLVELDEEEHPDKDLILRLRFAIEKISNKRYLMDWARIPLPGNWWAMTVTEEELRGQEDLTDPRVLEATLLLLPTTVNQLAWHGRGGLGHLLTWPGRPGEVLGLVIDNLGQVVWYGSDSSWERLVTRAVLRGKEEQ